MRQQNWSTVHLMWASRKPGGAGGGGSGTPGDSHLVGLARGRPGVGAHLGRQGRAWVRPSLPGDGETHFSPRFLMCFAPLRVVTTVTPCPHGRRRYRCKECGGSGICEHGRERSICKECGGSGICESTGGSAANARSAAAAG